MRENNGCRVKPEIREMAVFAVQDVIKDPPFTKLDLLSCRNLLIYLEPELQRHLILVFHYALKPGGLLFLGSSETIDGFGNLFAVVDKRAKLFRRRDTNGSLGPMLRLPPAAGRAVPPPAGGRPAPKELSVPVTAERFLLEQFAPPAVLVNRAGEILFTHGHTGRYLELSPGRAKLNVLDMAREDFRHELMGALRRAFARKSAVVLQNLRVKTNGGARVINLIVRPLRDARMPGEVALVVFQEVRENGGKGRKAKAARGGVRAAARIAELEKELGYTRSHLQSVIEELETANEELKSYNEELQSANEELQSTNEELETSKEELQSLNEELMTVNVELQNKNEELARANEDMRNLLDNIRIATIFLDSQLRIKRFTTETRKVVNVIDSDVGRPLGDIVTNLEVDLTAKARKVIETLSPTEEETRSRDGRIYLLRIFPYRTVKNVIDGVVVMLVEVTDFAAGRGQS